MTKKTPTSELSIIILSYNVRELLTNCLNSLYADPKSKNWQIIVVDNASSDDSVIYTKKHFPLVELIESETNLGFSAGNNLALPHVTSDHILFLNPDTVVPKGTIPYILKQLKSDPQIGAATCKVMLPNGQLDDGCHRGFPSPWNALCHFSGLSKLFPKVPIFSGYNLTYLDLETSHPIPSLTGAFMMLPKSVGDQVNWWDQDYFWNGEDLDFCFRINQAGYQVMYYPQVQITHYKGSSGGYKSTSHGKNKASQATKLMAAKSSTQAMRIFYNKHYRSKYPTIVTQITMFGINLLEQRRLKAVSST